MTELIRRSLWSSEVEQSVLGALMLDDSCLPEVQACGLNPDVFFDRRHRNIYSAILNLAERNVPLDVVTVAEQLEDQGVIDQCGGGQYLVRLVDAVPSIDNAAYYARRAVDYQVERQFHQASMDIQRILFEGEYADHAARVADIQQVLSNTEKQDRVQSLVELRAGMKSVLEYIDRKANEEVPEALFTGYEYIDSRTGGFEGGDLIIVAGRPSMGKTAYILNVARNNYMAGKNGLVFSLEMGVRAQCMRIMGAHSSVKLGLIKSGKVFDYDESAARFAAGTTALTGGQGNLFFDEEAGLPITELVARARRQHRKTPLDYVIVDHIGLVESTLRTEQSAARVGQVSRALKKLAKDLNCPVFALSQVNRECEKRPNKRPRNSDLRDSGSVEQDADVIQFVFRPEYYDENNADLKGQLEIIHGKVREGETGTDYLTFKGSYGRVEDLKIQPVGDGGSSGKSWSPA